GDYWASAPGAYLPAASNSGTIAHRRASRAVRQTDAMAKPSQQAILLSSNRARHDKTDLSRLSTFPRSLCQRPSGPGKGRLGRQAPNPLSREDRNALGISQNGHAENVENRLKGGVRTCHLGGG